MEEEKKSLVRFGVKRKFRKEKREKRKEKKGRNLCDHLKRKTYRT